jgi:hypothetical protein
MATENINIYFSSPCPYPGKEYPYIHVANPKEDIERQYHPDEIVIPISTIEVIYSYPLSVKTTRSFNADKPEGFTRAHLARIVCDGYKQIYQEEENAVGDPGNIHGMFNRKKSHGPYGIWGHNISDLDLYSVCQEEGNTFTLLVDS